MGGSAWPGLRLVAAPTGTAQVRGRAVHLGDDIALGSGLSLGTEGEVRVAAAVQKLHCRIEPRGADGGARLWHYGKGFRSAINGMNRLEGQLSHRDLVGLSGGTLFRYLERDDVVAIEPSLERDIEARPDDAARLLVWADWLQEQGDPLGARISAAHRGEAQDHEPWLDGWAAHFVSGRLDVDWHLGLARRAAVREVSMSFASLPIALERLLALRAFRFLRELTVHLASERAFEPEQAQQLSGLTGPRTLERLSIGPVPEALEARTRAVLPRLEGLAARFPLLKLQPLEVFTRGVLEVLGAHPDSGRAPGDVIDIGERVLLGLERTTSPVSGTWLARRERHRYVLDVLTGPRFPMVVKGREVQRYPLCDGDEVTLGQAMTVRFALRRS